jgi:hypothetical protein
MNSKGFSPGLSVRNGNQAFFRSLFSHAISACFAKGLQRLLKNPVLL